ncbi:hypothetical protein RUM44_008542 [Polyplax serrata]|uniref:Uncharacterized protein n=1 Tax=Polyplax serrata TaxID=468196 RepID=A0ABR1BCR5_POLSC
MVRRKEEGWTEKMDARVERDEKMRGEKKTELNPENRRDRKEQGNNVEFRKVLTGNENSPRGRNKKEESIPSGRIESSSCGKICKTFRSIGAASSKEDPERRELTRDVGWIMTLRMPRKRVLLSEESTTVDGERQQHFQMIKKMSNIYGSDFFLNVNCFIFSKFNA